MAFCTECGANMPGGVRFCTSCGASFEPALPASNIHNVEAPPRSGSKYAVMGTGAYIGYSILFSIPLVGFIFCIITAFTATNLNRRNFARAMMVFMIIGIVLSIALYLFVSWVLEAVSMSIGTDIFDLMNS